MAHGQSTEILAKYMNGDRRIISIDNDAYGVLNKTRERLSKYKNLEIIEGRTQDILAQLIADNLSCKKAFLIDGPKGFLAMGFVDGLFRFQNVFFAAVDDTCHKDDDEIPYHFMDILPHTAFYSDEEWYQEKYGHLDHKEEMKLNNHGAAYALNISVHLHIEDWIHFWQPELKQERLKKVTRQIFKAAIKNKTADLSSLKMHGVNNIEDIDSCLNSHIVVPAGDLHGGGGVIIKI